MTRIYLILLCAISLGASSSVFAQDGPPKWTVGGLGLGYYSPFEAERTNGTIDLNGVPYIAYHGERFYIEGRGLGYKLLEPNNGPVQFQLDVVASARMLPGASRSKVTADAGFRLGVSGQYGSLSFTGLRDVTDTHNGYEVKTTYSYTFRGKKFSFTPSISAVWQDKNMSNHMWGVTQKQQDKMIKDNKPVLPVFELTESVVNFSANMFFTYRFADSWSFIAFGGATYLDKKIRINPGIDKKYDASIGFGVGYSF